MSIWMLACVWTCEKSEVNVGYPSPLEFWDRVFYRAWSSPIPHDLANKSPVFSCLCLPGAGIVGRRYYPQLLCGWQGSKFRSSGSGIEHFINCTASPERLLTSQETAEFQKNQLCFFKHCSEWDTIYDDIWILKYVIGIGEMAQQLMYSFFFQMEDPSLAPSTHIKWL